jgi:hypothetical protein
MKLYGGIDVHSNNSVVALSDEEDHVFYCKRLPNEAASVLDALELYRASAPVVACAAGADLGTVPTISQEFQRARGRVPTPLGSGPIASIRRLVRIGVDPSHIQREPTARPR